jgi:O-antigen/teichoic acid export membrane protein
MSEASFPKLVQGTARGSLILIAGQLITGIISTITIIWLARVLGPTGYGDYTLALLPVSIALLFQDFGMNQSLMRFSAMYRYEKREELKVIVWTGLIFEIATSLVITVILYVFAGQIASSLLLRPELEPLVKVAALAVLGNGGVQTTIGAIFVGYELMGLRSVLNILFAVIRGILGVSLIIIGLGAFGAIVSYSAALLLSSLIGFLLFLKFVKFGKEQQGIFDFKTLRTLLTYGFPISISAILNGALSQLNSYLLAFFVATDLIGNYGATQNFGVIITFFTLPIQSSLLPLFSKFKRDDPKLQTVFRLSVKYTAIITLPIAFVIIALASPISYVIYGANYSYVPLYLSLYLLAYVLDGLGVIPLSNLLLGLGETRVILYTGIISILVGAPLAVILVSRYQVVGLLITLIIAPRFGWFYQTLWTKKRLNVTLDVRETISIYLSVITAFISTYFLVNYIDFGKWGAIVLGGLFFAAIYVFSLLGTKSVRRLDLEQIMETTDSFGPLSALIQRILSILAKFVRD